MGRAGSSSEYSHWSVWCGVRGEPCVGASHLYRGQRSATLGWAQRAVAAPDSAALCSALAPPTGSGWPVLAGPGRVTGSVPPVPGVAPEFPCSSGARVRWSGPQDRVHSLDSAHLRLPRSAGAATDSSVARVAALAWPGEAAGGGPHFVTCRSSIPRRQEWTREP